MDLKSEADVALARKHARLIGMSVGLEPLDQTRLATVVSELGRNAVRYVGTGRIAFSVIDTAASQAVEVEITDTGRGIPQLEEVLAGSYRSDAGAGQGIAGSRRLMDSFAIESGTTGTTIVFSKRIAATRPRFTDSSKRDLLQRIEKERRQDPVGELQHQNTELLSALATLKAQHEQINQLNLALAARDAALSAEVATSNTARAIADDRNSAKSHFLSVISHELRTPLGAILGYARLIEIGGEGALSEEQRGYLARIVQAQSHLVRLSDDLLSFAKLESGTLEVGKLPVSVRDLCVATETLTAPQLSERALTFDSRCNSGELTVLADEGKVQQILLNLVTNASKFTPAGGTITMDSAADADTVELTVRDTGRGIPADMLEAIFEPFVQVDSSTNTKTGVGLGLPISRELARAMNGDLRVVSELGHGAAFTLTLPRLHEPHVAERSVVFEARLGGAADPLLEFANPLADRRRNVGDALGAEQQQADDGDDGELGKSDVAKH